MQAAYDWVSSLWNFSRERVDAALDEVVCAPESTISPPPPEVEPDTPAEVVPVIPAPAPVPVPVEAVPVPKEIAPAPAPAAPVSPAPDAAVAAVAEEKEKLAFYGSRECIHPRKRGSPRGLVQGATYAYYCDLIRAHTSIPTPPRCASSKLHFKAWFDKVDRFWDGATSDEKDEFGRLVRENKVPVRQVVADRLVPFLGEKFQTLDYETKALVLVHWAHRRDEYSRKIAEHKRAALAAAADDEDESDDEPPKKKARAK
jgi:hypothetical protein